MELFDLYRPDGSVTGEVKERSLVHRDGDLHAASHIFILRGTGPQTEVLLQKRSARKDSWPGCLDTSCAGHLTAGDDFIGGALRECSEELGLPVTREELVPLFDFRIDTDTEFRGKPFRDHELVRVYRLTRPVDIRDLTLQESEVESVCWMSMKEALEEIRSGSGRICIFPPEFEKLCAVVVPEGME